MKRLSTIFVALMLYFSGTAAYSQESPSKFPIEQDARIPAGSKVFIAPLDNGYHLYLAAALQKKQVPLVIVTDKSRADFELSAVTESEKAGWAKMLFMSSGASGEQASIVLVNIKAGTVVFGYNVNKSSSARGKQSSSEACAKHIKEKIESGK